MSIALAVPQLALRPISKGRATLQPSKKQKMEGRGGGGGGKTPFLQKKAKKCEQV